ncbi:MAG: acyl-CoA dehydrogenase family protein, partial [Pseudonocardia sp.]|nr:acyl-CoA dehydrogenase family protein [Pseudonocardia sp.]
MTEEQRALRDAVGDAVAGMRPIAAVRGTYDGTDGGGATASDRWATLARLGVFGAALPSDAGGAGGTAADAAVAVERCAAALVPGPVLPTVLAGLVLAGRPDVEAAAELLPGIADGSTPVGAALAPVPLDVRDGPGGPRVDGAVPAVLGAGDAPALLLLGAGAPGGG